MAVKSKEAPGAALMPFSYSRLSCFEECPRKAKYQYIDKIKTPEKAVFEKGNRVHEALETFVSGAGGIRTMAKLKMVFQTAKAKLTPKPMEEIARLSGERKNGRVLTEDRWGFDRKWQSLASWFADGIYCRMVVDACVLHGDEILEIVDYKTGRMYDHHADQGELYALGGLCKYPGVERVDVKFIYLEHNVVTEKAYMRSQSARLKNAWTARAKKMETAKTFPALRETANCKWCEFRAHCQKEGQ